MRLYVAAILAAALALLEEEANMSVLGASEWNKIDATRWIRTLHGLYNFWTDRWKLCWSLVDHVL